MAEGRRQEFDVLSIREREGGKDVFTKIGVALNRHEAEGI